MASIIRSQYNLFMIDLRSDTVTRPTAEMRLAIASAEVGDDVYGDDPTVLALERRTADLLGKEAAIYMPTGTMTNQVALRTHTEAGDEVLTDSQAHVSQAESGAPAAINGVMLRYLPSQRGIFGGDDVRRAIFSPHKFNPKTLGSPTRLVWIENTHNAGGGSVWPIERIEEVTNTAREMGLALHLDGARLWHASIASGVTEAEYANPFDSVSVCFSKGLGAPVGSALAGSAKFIARARRFKAMFGGGFRQAGIIAAGAIYALDHHRLRLADDHRHAKEFAEGLLQLPGIEIDPTVVETNIVRFQVTASSASQLVESCYEKGLYMLPTGPDSVRAIMHLDISDQQAQEAVKIVASAVNNCLS